MDPLFDLITVAAAFHYMWLLWRHVVNDCPERVSHGETVLDHLCWDGNIHPGAMEDCSCAEKWLQQPTRGEESS